MPETVRGEIISPHCLIVSLFWRKSDFRTQTWRVQPEELLTVQLCRKERFYLLVLETLSLNVSRLQCVDVCLWLSSIHPFIHLSLLNHWLNTLIPSVWCRYWLQRQCPTPRHTVSVTDWKSFSTVSLKSFNMKVFAWGSTKLQPL